MNVNISGLVKSGQVEQLKNILAPQIKKYEKKTREEFLKTLEDARFDALRMDKRSAGESKETRRLEGVINEWDKKKHHFETSDSDYLKEYRIAIMCSNNRFIELFLWHVSFSDKLFSAKWGSEKNFFMHYAIKANNSDKTELFTIENYNKLRSDSSKGDLEDEGYRRIGTSAYGFSPLTEAARQGNRVAVKYYLKTLPSLEKSINEALHRVKIEQKTYESGPKYDKCIQKFQNTLKTLFDYGCSLNLFTNDNGKHLLKSKILKEINVTDFCFVGITFNGKPITKDILIENGINGAENALYTIDDIKKLSDETRRNDILQNIEVRVKQYGKTVQDDGMLNAIPLNLAAYYGNYSIVKSRLECGFDPNSTIKFKSKKIPSVLYWGTNTPLSLSWKGKHYEVFGLLANQENIDVDELFQIYVHVNNRDNQEKMDTFLKHVNIGMKNSDGTGLLVNTITSLYELLSFESSSGSGVRKILEKREYKLEAAELDLALVATLQISNAKCRDAIFLELQKAGLDLDRRIQFKTENGEIKNWLPITIALYYDKHSLVPKLFSQTGTLTRKESTSEGYPWYYELVDACFNTQRNQKEPKRTPLFDYLDRECSFKFFNKTKDFLLELKAKGADFNPVGNPQFKDVLYQALYYNFVGENYVKFHDWMLSLFVHAHAERVPLPNGHTAVRFKDVNESKEFLYYISQMEGFYEQHKLMIDELGVDPEWKEENNPKRPFEKFIDSLGRKPELKEKFLTLYNKHRPSQQSTDKS